MMSCSPCLRPGRPRARPLAEVGFLFLAGTVPVLALTLPTHAFAQAGAFAPETVFSAGTPVESPLTGVTFTVPGGFRGEWDPDAGGLVVESERGVLGAVWAFSEGSVEDVAAGLGGRLAALGLQLEPREEPEVTGTTLDGTFHAWSQEGQGVLHAAIRRGEAGNVLAVAALGAPDAEEPLASFVSEVLRSLEWSEPGAGSWRAEVEGAVLSWSGGGSDMSTGGSGTATGASSSTATLALCPGQVYRYEESSESYVSIEGMSASNQSSDAHAGQWWLIADLAGRAILFLDATDGRAFQWGVEEAGGDAYLVDGYRYVLSGSC